MNDGLGVPSTYEVSFERSNAMSETYHVNCNGSNDTKLPRSVLTHVKQSLPSNLLTSQEAQEVGIASVYTSADGI